MIEASEALERDQQGLATVVTIADGVDRAVRRARWLLDRPYPRHRHPVT
jgi:hypothetical protein